MSTAPNHLTPEEYLEIERKAEFRSEYFDGQMYAMSGGSRAHSLLAVRLATLTSAHLEKRGCEAYVADMRVLVEASDLYTYPDLAAVCDEPRFADAAVDTLLNPALLAEVLSPSTERYDRGLKAKLYRSIPSLRELLLVAQDVAEVELFRRDGSEWRIISAVGLDASIELRSIGFILNLGELYRGILPESADSAAG